MGCGFRVWKFHLKISQWEKTLPPVGYGSWEGSFSSRWLVFGGKEVSIPETGPIRKPYIFDQIRKKWLICTSEEWVRIHCLNYFTQTLGYPASWIKVENVINLYDTRKRFDLMIMDPNQGNLILVECKSPNILINQNVASSEHRTQLSNVQTTRVVVKIC